MQTISPAAMRAFEEGLSLTALPRVIVEWNQNRFAENVVATTTDPGQETGGEVEHDDPNPEATRTSKKKYPIESIVWANRPTRGIPKARVGEARTSKRNADIKYRVTSAGAHYKYWSSSKQSASAIVGGAYAITDANATVTYDTAVKTNKIVIKFENSWASPTRWTVERKVGTSWAVIATNPALDANGVTTLYLQSDLTWGTTASLGTETNINGIRITVTGMSEANSHLNVIEVSARLEKDITSDIISVSTDRSMDAADIASPIGTASANSASVVLDNTTTNYDVENPASPFYGLMDTNAEVRVWLGVDTSAFGGTGMEYISQGVYYSNAWQVASDNSTVTIDCMDFAKFLQDTRITPILLESKTVPQILREILRRTGFNNFSIPDDDSEPIIGYVWFNDSETVWSAIQEICRATQGAFYFDENGTGRYVSKGMLFSQLEAPADLTLRGEKDNAVPLAQPNIISLDHEYDTLINKVNITYSPKIENTKTQYVASMEGTNTGKKTMFDLVKPDSGIKYSTVPVSSVLWQPTGSVSLAASMLTKSMTATDNVVYINEREAGIWPFKGKFNIEGEIMSFRGKMYRYRKNGTVQNIVLYSMEEKKAIDEYSDDATVSQNKFTGELRDVVRDPKHAVAHSVDIASWRNRLWNGGTAQSQTAADAAVRQEQSSIVLRGPSIAAGGVNGAPSYEAYLMSARGASGDQFNVYGTRMRFGVVQARHNTAGIFLNRQPDGHTCYIVEFNTTAMSLGPLKGNVLNARVYKLFNDGTRIAMPNTPEQIRGVAYNIVPGQWFNVDVTYNREQKIWILYINGQRQYQWTDTNSPLNGGEWGVFTRGDSVALFEYFYVNNTTGAPPDIDDSNFYHKIQGGFTSGYADREMGRDSKNKLQWFFDDFGPWVHEIREFDVEFDKFPVKRPYLYLTNTWDAFLMDEGYSPFSGKFVIANAGRDTAILSGEDTTVQFGKVVQQQMLIFGQLVFEEETKKITVENSASIRRRGEVVLDVESKWIQSEGQARDFGKFITNHWGQPADNITVEVFHNPALQIGDMVDVYWPTRHMTPETHRYFVHNMSVGFDKGITGTISLRRAR